MNTLIVLCFLAAAGFLIWSVVKRNTGSSIPGGGA